MTVITTLTVREAIAAMCLWEVVVDPGEHDMPRPWQAFRDEHGTCELRDKVLALAPSCEAAWNALSVDEQDAAGAFDWEYCPAWLCNSVDWVVRIMSLHRCTDTDCPYKGQSSPRSCTCHQTDEQTLRVRSAMLLASLQALLSQVIETSAYADAKQGHDPALLEDVRLAEVVIANALAWS